MFLFLGSLYLKYIQRFKKKKVYRYLSVTANKHANIVAFIHIKVFIHVFFHSPISTMVSSHQQLYSN